MKIICRVILILWVILLFNFIRLQMASGRPKRMITITDALGKKVVLPTPVKRIVVINSDAAEILCALGVDEKIVGVSENIRTIDSDLLTGLKETPIVGSWRNPSIEKIIELRPDLVISYESWLSEEAFEAKLSPAGIHVIRIPCYRINSLEEDIIILGKITGRKKRALEYVRHYRGYLNIVKRHLDGIKDKVRIYAESYGNYVSVSKGSGGDEILKIAGVNNIALRQPVPFPRVCPEWVAEKDPKMIIKAVSSSCTRMGYGISDIKSIIDFRNNLIRRPVWDQDRKSVV